ncbi:hypothetical protein [Pedobacter sp. MC2016-24]|uniref:hypothetical protein n=1 Tax=Pedobacter sp. MC2016-24 TaxID=2780090 RepID=UPI001881D6D4|nr:hypothetical protein [Pedobacter sp. MC2016-24]MBE9602573.1 hypothetical protein [Pedobacter sp. MC2016-24]
MCRKITSIFILMAFLLVKGTSLCITDQDKHALSYFTSDQESEEKPAGDKSGKCIEFHDDDFLPNYAFELLPFESAKRINHDAALQLMPIYISSVNPPPDCIALVG